MYHWIHILHTINSERPARLLNVFGQIAMFWKIKKKLFQTMVYAFNLPFLY